MDEMLQQRDDGCRKLMDDDRDGERGKGGEGGGGKTRLDEHHARDWVCGVRSTSYFSETNLPTRGNP